MLAAPSEMKLRWSELEKAIFGHTISLSLPDGHCLEGKVVSIGPDTLEVNVGKTSDSNALPKGKHSFPRASISQIGLRTKRVKGRIIGVSSGLAVAGGSIGAGLAMQSWGGLGVAFFGAMVGVGVMGAGYLIANDRDRQLTMITVLKD